MTYSINSSVDFNQHVIKLRVVWAQRRRWLVAVQTQCKQNVVWESSEKRQERSDDAENSPMVAAWTQRDRSINAVNTLRNKDEVMRRPRTRGGNIEKDSVLMVNSIWHSNYHIHGRREDAILAWRAYQKWFECFETNVCLFRKLIGTHSSPKRPLFNAQSRRIWGHHYSF